VADDGGDELLVVFDVLRLQRAECNGDPLAEGGVVKPGGGWAVLPLILVL